MNKGMQCLLTLIFLLFAIDGYAKTASEVFDAVSSSVVVVRTFDATGKNRGFGSGVALASDLIATNCHVIKGAASIEVAHQGKGQLATVRHSDWDRDVCTLAVSGINAPAVVVGHTSSLKVGTRVYAIGAPQGLELTLSEGIISSLHPVEGGQYLQISAPISPGSSGGGLFDEEGRLIGLPTFYLSEGQQLNFAVPVEWIVELPKRQKETVNSEETTTIHWLKKTMAIIKKKDWVSLLAHALRWTEAQPKEANAWFALGLAYSKTGQTAKTIEAYQQVLHINPKNAEAWNNLGNAYIQSGQIAKAIEALQQALRINPEEAETWGNLGVAYDKSGQKTEVMQVYKRLKTLDPAKADEFFNKVVLP
jgi:hypothetical protein